MRFYTTATNPVAHASRCGFSFLFDSTVSSITFHSGQNSISANDKVYQFGDFVGFVSSNAVKVQPIDGIKVGYPTTGQWIKVENCYMMFYGCKSLTALDFSMFDTSEVENMSHMFYGCSSLTALDLSTFDTSNVKSMSAMFRQCEALTALNLSNFDTSNVTNMSYMFYGCTSLTTLDISSFDMTNVVSRDHMFGTATAAFPPLTTLKTPKINPHNNIPLNRTLYSQDGTAYTKLPVTTGTSIELRTSWT